MHIRSTFLGKSMSCIQCSSLNPCPETAREKARSCTIVHANKSGFYPCKLQFIAKTRICTDQPRQARHRGDADGRGQLSRSSLAISTQIRIFFSSVLSWFLRCDIKVYLYNSKYGWTRMDCYDIDVTIYWYNTYNVWNEEFRGYLMLARLYLFRIDIQ